jgi:YD repeat-containing protein
MTFSTLVRLALTFGMVASATAAYAAETVTHKYDALGRLKQSTKSGGPAAGQQTTITYDPAGNRSNQTVTGAPPPPSP